jgi:transketolase
MRERFTSVVGDLLDTDDRTVAVLAVISHSLFTQAGITARHPDRVIDVGIREQAQIGVAGGLALEGLRPIVTGYAPFLVERTFEQVKLDFDHQGTSAILASVGGTWDSAASGRTHQAPEDVSLLVSLRTWTVRVPGHPDELEVLLRRDHANGERAYLRMTNDANRSFQSPHPDRIATVRQGSEGAPTVLGIGPVLDQILEATADLDVTVLYTATPFPIDVDGVRVSATGSDIAIIEPYLAGTSMFPVVEALSDRPMRFHAHGVRTVDTHRFGTPEDHRRFHGLDAPGIRSWLDTAIPARSSVPA